MSEPQLAPVPASMPPGARKIPATLTERSVRKNLLRVLASEAMGEYRIARVMHAVAEAEREGAWFAYDCAARGDGCAAGSWRALWAYYRQALTAERAAEARLRAAVDALTGVC